MKVAIAAAVLLIFAIPNCACGDTFHVGTGSFDIEFVTIGNPGNVADRTGTPNPAGAVAYSYRIGKYEISDDMVHKVIGLSPNPEGPNKPAQHVNWFVAAAFVNWLNTSTESPPAYKLNGLTSMQLWTESDAGFDPANRFRNKLATYFLPSVHEWYKAAYYDPLNAVYYDFPTGSNSEPTPVLSGTAPGTAVFGTSYAPPHADIDQAGGLSPYGTMAQGGNVAEWLETEFDQVNDSPNGGRFVRGGSLTNGFTMPAYRTYSGSPGIGLFDLGFRVASMVIPEPSAILLAIAGVATLPTRRRPSISRNFTSSSVTPDWRHFD